MSIYNMNQQDIEQWMPLKGHLMFKYQLNYNVVSTFLIFSVAVLIGGAAVWFFGDWTRKQSTGLWLIVGSFNATIWVRTWLAVRFVGRNYLGISPSEMIIVRGYKGIRIPFQELEENSIEWHEQSPGRGGSTLPIHVRGHLIHVPLVNLYYSVKHFPVFISRLIEYSENSINK